MATAAFSTTSANELLLAFVSADAPSSGANTTVTGVTGGGLSWALVQRTNTQRGTAEICSAFAPSLLANVTVTATLSRSTISSMTVMTFTGVDTTGGAIGAKGTGNSGQGAPTATLTTTRNNSFVIGVGNDWDNAINRTARRKSNRGSYGFSPTQDTYWVQRENSTTPASGTPVTINDTAPTGDRYNLSIVEVRAPSTVTVPNVVGATQAAATAALTKFRSHCRHHYHGVQHNCSSRISHQSEPGKRHASRSWQCRGTGNFCRRVPVTVPTVVRDTQAEATTDNNQPVSPQALLPRRSARRFRPDRSSARTRLAARKSQPALRWPW